MSRYTLWNPPPIHERAPLRAGAKLSRKELQEVKKEIDAELKKTGSVGREAVPSPLSLIRKYD